MSKLILGEKKMTPTYAELVNGMHRTFETGITRNVDFRVAQLKNLLRMYEENVHVMAEALANDLRKSKFESIVAEITFIINEVKTLIEHVKEWSRPERPGKSLVTLLDGVYIYKEPYGVVLVMGAWNYPIQLSLIPFGGAIAAGNCVILKPSELAPASAKVMANLIPQYLHNDCYKVICGGANECTELLKNRFNYIFYTGSTTVGRIVHAAANKHLTPVTLELGGKSPVYLDDTVNMETAAKRILWGKCINLGQTCVAPDYVLCSKKVEAKFVQCAKHILNEWLGSKPEQSPDLCRIITDKHFERLMQFLSNGTIAVGGGFHADSRFIEPTVLVDVKPTDAVMQEEIFGPILPVITVNSAREAANFINARDNPLALYVFTNDNQVKDLFVNTTRAGGMCINDVIMHFSVDTLPFGGVGNSGMGAYHGRYTFDTFSHHKSCLSKQLHKFGEMLTSARYPPYNSRKLAFLNLIMKKRSFPIGFIMSSVKYLIVFGLGVTGAYLYQSWRRQGQLQ